MTCVSRFQYGMIRSFVVAVLVSVPVWAALADPLPTHHFAQREKVWGPKLSADGSRLAVLERVNGDEVITRYRIDGAALVPLGQTASGLENDYFRVRWASEDRILVSSVLRNRSRTFGDGSPLRQLLSMKPDGSDKVILLSQRRNARPRFAGDGIVHMLPDDPAHILVRLIDIGNEDDSFVYRMNIYTGDRELIEEAASGQDIFNWYADWDGTIRYAFGQDNKNRQIMLIRRADGDWHPLHKYELFADGRFYPLGYSYDDNTIFVLSSHITGRASLYKFDLSTGDLAGKIFSHEDVDLDSPVISEASRKAVAVSYTVDKKEYHYLDPSYEELRDKVDNALPDRINAIVSTTADEQRLVVMSESTTHSGTYYLYDLTNEALTEIGQRYDGLYEEDLSPMQRVTYEARDSLEIPAYLTVPKVPVTQAAGRPNARPGPVVILPHGGPRTRDRLGFDLWAQFLANRGYVVLQPNFRGSRGYGERYESLGHGTWGRAMQDDLTDGAQWLIDQGLADPKRICIVGASYGGYAALMGIIRAPDMFQCGASLNGVSDIRRMMRADGDYDTRSSEFRRVAGRLSKSELDLISPIDRADEINVPVLLVHGEEDRNVSVRHSRQLAAKLERDGKSNTLVVIPDEGHSFRKDESLLIWLSALEKFLAENIGPESLHSRTDMTSLDE